MYKGKTFLAVIPARGGSKRLPRKNVLELAGKPLVAWTIEAAIGSQYIDKIIVSTDDSEIETVSAQFGAQVLKRPAELATDTATSIDVVQHAVEALKSYFDYIILLQPTSPVRSSKHIDEAIVLLDKNKAQAVVSVCEVEHSPLWTNTLPEDGRMDGFLRTEIKNKRSQDLPKYYRINGAIYIVDKDVLSKKRTFFPDENIFAYLMPRRDSVDIDCELDYRMAKSILEE